VRGGSREMDMMLKQAGASVISLPSNEIYAAMQTGAMEAAMTSSTSFLSFKLEEIAKFLTTGRNKAYWFMLGAADDLQGGLRPPDQGPAGRADGPGRRDGALPARKPRPTTAAPPTSTPRPAPRSSTWTGHRRKWQAIARDTAWKDFGERNESCAGLLAAAQKLL
jgi:hypothetical protein